MPPPDVKLLVENSLSHAFEAKPSPDNFLPQSGGFGRSNYAIETNGVVGDVTYFDFDKPQLTQEDSARLFRSQFPIYTWADKEYKKRLGQEKGKHWTHTQWIVHSAMVLHEGKSFISNPKDKGWQFRTPEQFWAEQAVIKALKKEWWKQEKAKRTPPKKSETSKASAS